MAKRKCKRAKAAISQGGQRVIVALPCGTRKLTSTNRAKVMNAKGIGRAFSNPDMCRVVFFTAGKPIVRCEGRRLKATNKRQCRARSGPKQGKYVKCPSFPGQRGRQSRRQSRRRSAR